MAANRQKKLKEAQYHQEAEKLLPEITPDQLLHPHGHVDPTRVFKVKINYAGTVFATGTYDQLYQYFQREGKKFISPEKKSKPYVEYDTYIQEKDVFWYRYGVMLMCGAGFLSTAISCGLIYLNANYFSDIVLGNKDPSYMAPVSLLFTTVTTSLLFGGVKTLDNKYEKAKARVEQVPNHKYIVSKM